jgi:hypothetical protein
MSENVKSKDVTWHAVIGHNVGTDLWVSVGRLPTLDIWGKIMIISDAAQTKDRKGLNEII